MIGTKATLLVRIWARDGSYYMTSLLPKGGRGNVAGNLLSLYVMTPATL